MTLRQVFCTRSRSDLFSCVSPLCQTTGACSKTLCMYSVYTIIISSHGTWYVATDLIRHVIDSIIDNISNKIVDENINILFLFLIGFRSGFFWPLASPFLANVFCEQELEALRVVFRYWNFYQGNLTYYRRHSS